MKRSAALTPLSHEHHQALFVAMQLKRAEDDGPGQVYLDFLTDGGARHFEIEETILLPGWAAGDPRSDKASSDRVLREHRELLAGAERIRSGETGVDELHEIGELLGSHVRFEERELFPAIEAGMEEEALADLGEAIKAAEAGC